MEFRTILRVPQLAVPRVPSVESLLSGKYQASIMAFDASPSAYGSRFHRSFPLRITLPSIIFITAAITSSGGSPPRNGTIVLPIQQEDSPEQNYYANAHPYLEESLDTLRKRIPELGKIHPADDLQQLPGILQKTASNVDSFFRDIVDVIANEKITQERLDSIGLVMASERVPDNYLILRHLNAARADIVEYRMDDQGNRMDHPGLNEGYFAPRLRLDLQLLLHRVSTGVEVPLSWRSKDRPARFLCRSVRSAARLRPPFLSPWQDEAVRACLC